MSKSPKKPRCIVITQERLKEILNYDSESGVFTWKEKYANCIKLGTIAGCQRPDGRWALRLYGREYLAHRAAWCYTYGDFPVGMLDHVDGNPLNNAISNLRVCSQVGNQKNVKKRTDNSSGYKGVHKVTQRNKIKYVAGIMVKGEKQYLGIYETAEAASDAYEAAAKEHHGEFYRDTTKEANFEEETNSNL